MQLTQLETTLLISACLLAVATVILIVAIRTLHKSTQEKQKSRGYLKETITLRSVMLEERLATKGGTAHATSGETTEN